MIAKCSIHLQIQYTYENKMASSETDSSPSSDGNNRQIMVNCVF